MPNVMTLLRDGVDVALLAGRLGPDLATLGAAQHVVGEHLARALVGADHRRSRGRGWRSSSSWPRWSRPTSSSNRRADLLGLARRAACTSLPRTLISVLGEGVLDLAEVLVAGTDERRHQVRARDDDGGGVVGVAVMKSPRAVRAHVADQRSCSAPTPTLDQRAPGLSRVPAGWRACPGWPCSTARSPACRARGRAPRWPPAPSSGAAPPPGGKPHQRAPRMRSRWAWANSTTVPSAVAEPGEDPIDPASDLLERLAGADRGGPDRPVRVGDAQVDRAHALVLAVVPLDEVVDHHGVLAEPGQLARAPGPLAAGSSTRWRRRPSPALPGSGASSRARASPSALSGTSVRPVCRRSRAPVGLAVSHEHHAVGHGRGR